MNLVINSQFRPFTYDEMVKPLVQYKEVYDKIEQDYSDLASQTEMWGDIVNQTNSPEAYAMFKGYSDQLNSIVEDFSKGMTLSNRRALLGMKRDYAKNITPIARASEAMKEANDLRVKAGPDAIFELGEYNSLDQFLHGKTANNRYQSKEALTKKTAAMTEAAMAEALKDPEFKNFIGDQFYLITQHTGGSYDDLVAAISNNKQAQSRFAEIKQRVMQDAGIDRYDAVGRQAIEDAVNTGLYAGLDKPVRSFQANADHITPAQRHSMSMQQAQLDLQAASSGMSKGTDGEWTYDPAKDPAVHRAGKKGSNGRGSSTTRVELLPKPVMVVAGKDDQSADYDFSTDRDYGQVSVISDEDIDGTPVNFRDLHSSAKELIEKQIGRGNEKYYTIYETRTDRSRWWTGDNVAYQIVPKKSVIVNNDGTQSQGEIDFNAE